MGIIFGAPPVTILPTFDAVGAANNGTGNLTWAHIAASGAYVLSFVTMSGPKTVTGITIAGQAMSLINSIGFNDNAATYGSLYMFGLTAPSAGSLSIVATVTGSSGYGAVGNSLSYINVESVGTPVTAWASGIATDTVTCSPVQVIVNALACQATTFSGSTSGGNQRYTGAYGTSAGLNFADSRASTTFIATQGNPAQYVADAVVLS